VGSRPPIFIVGCPRSGTTLLRDLLGSHPALTFPPESHFIPRLYKAYGAPRTEREARRLAAVVLRTSWIRWWELELTPADFASCRSYGEIVSRLFEAWTRKVGKSRWGDKTPEYVADIPTLLEIFPSCKIIHIYRDGRDVALSWIAFRYGPGNTFAAARRWKEQVTAGRRAGAVLSPATYREVRYETLVTEPDATMKGVYEFLEEPVFPAVLTPGPMSTTPDPFWIGRQAPTQMPGRAVVSASCGRWKEAMTVADRGLFESVAGDLLAELGYETENLARVVSRREQLEWRFHDASWWLFWRLNRKGKRRWLPGELALLWARIQHRLHRRAPDATRGM
jgi:hypothetical protein